MIEPIDIELKVRFDWGDDYREMERSGLPAGLVGSVLDIINDTLYHSEMQSLEEIASAIQLSPVELDALRYRMRLHRESGLVIKDASSDSLHLGGIVTNRSLWLIARLISEPFKEAWRDSAIQKKLTEILKTDIAAQAKRFAESIKKGLSTLKAPSRVEVITDKRDVTISIKIIMGKETVIPPSNSAILRKLYPLFAGKVFCDKLKDGSEGPEMVVLPAGSFEMGDVEGVGRESQLPIHSVTIARPFAMGKYPVTFDEYDHFCSETRRELALDDWGRGRHPVIYVSWNDAVAYTEWLSDQTGEEYRLPSEAEWEYAARGRSKQDTWAGTSNESELGDYAWHENNSGKQAHPVGEKKPNSFGLYDLSGNVWEWVLDCWNNNYEDAPADGSAWLSGDCNINVLRGGSWFSYRDDARCAFRFGYYHDSGTSIVGFRCARTFTL